MEEVDWAVYVVPLLLVLHHRQYLFSVLSAKGKSLWDGGTASTLCFEVSRVTVGQSYWLTLYIHSGRFLDLVPLDLCR